MLSRQSGTIVSRSFPASFTDQDYTELLRGPNPKRLPDAYTADRVPVYIWTEFEQRWAERRLDQFCLDHWETHNVACNAGRSNALNYIGNVVDQGVRYFSVGTGAGTPAATDTTMFTDFFRKVPTTVTLVGNQILISTSFTTAEGNTTYTEAGLIGGSTAVVTVGGAGTLFAHASYVYTKTSSIVLANGYYISLT